jgi:zinc protease
MDILNIDYEKYELSNGLEIILYHKPLLPITSVNLWYKVGSANEVEGKTGIAHLFEHMMFQGSQNVAKEMHFRYVQEAGGSLNGSTSFDRTNYYEKVPANFLELILWLESDRMGFLLPSLTEEKLKNQIDVVTNERLERYDNQPYGLAWEYLITNLYEKGHPYSWPTIGFMQDIQSYSLDDVKNFFRTYYAPNNASMVVAGKFEVDKTKDLIERYFSEIPIGKAVMPLNVNGTSLNQNVHLIHKENVQLERLYLAFHSEKAFGKFDASLDILADILTGSKSARLSRKLMFENELVQDVSAFQYSGKYGGHFIIAATAKPGKNISDIRQIIFKEIESICSNGVDEKEIVKSKNGIKTGFIFSMQNLEAIADHINFYNFFLGEPNSFNIDLNRYEEVDSSSIQKAVALHLTKPYVELIIEPE